MILEFEIKNQLRDDNNKFCLLFPAEEKYADIFISEVKLEIFLFF